ncbi:MAG: hypothetical protein V4850_32440 [Myxococcota bacterium]
METVVVTVQGDAGEVDSGIDLAVGDVVELSASGQVGHHQSLGANDLWNPDGTSANRQEGVTDRSGAFVFPDLVTFSLIGRVGDGDPFVVGFQISHSVTDSGRLCFHFNDHKGALGNNKGEFVVTVAITRSAKAVQDSCGAALDRVKRAFGDVLAERKSLEKPPNLTVTSCPVPYSNAQVKTNDDEASNSGSLAGLCFKAPKGTKLTITEEGRNEGGGTLFFVPPGCTTTWIGATFSQGAVDKGFLRKAPDGVYTHTVRSRREGEGAATTDGRDAGSAESWLFEQWLENWHHERWVETFRDGHGHEALTVAFRRTYSFTFQNDDAVLIFPRSTDPATVSFTATLE